MKEQIEVGFIPFARALSLFELLQQTIIAHGVIEAQLKVLTVFEGGEAACFFISLVFSKQTIRNYCLMQSEL
jgi:hypothetical protein